MKRTPMVRKTSLKPGQPLRRTELKTGGCSLKRTPIKPVSQKRTKANVQRTVVVNAMRLAAKGRCARCGETGLPVFGHERLGRAQGGSILSPDCLLCNQCNGWCEDNPRTAAWTGWKVSSKWPHDRALAIGQAFDLQGNVVVFSVGESLTDESSEWENSRAGQGVGSTRPALAPVRASGSKVV